MRDWLDILSRDDLCSTLALILLLLFIGPRMVRGQPRLETWGSRLAAGAFVPCCVAAAVAERAASAANFLGFALRGLLAAGLTLGLAWTALPLLAFVYGHTVGALRFKACSWMDARRLRATERRQLRLQEAERCRAEAEYARTAPERERWREEAEARAQAAAEAQQRRADARTNCELFFAQHAPEMGQRFPKDRFDDFVARHLGDDHPPEHVEQRAQQLLLLLREHLEKVGATQKKTTLADLAQWFLREKEQIDTAAIPDADKQVLIAALEERYAKLQEKLIRGLQP